MNLMDKQHKKIEAAWDALTQVIDPEIGENIVALGLVYAIVQQDQTVKVTLTMTSAACPMGDMIIDDVMQALDKVLPDTPTEVTLTWDPPWNPGMISAEAKTRLGWK